MGEKDACLDEPFIIDIPMDLEPDLSTTCWICKVPRKLRRVNEAAYTPQLVSIGPFHYAKPKLKAMEHHKTKYQQEFWKRDFCKHIGEKDIADFMRQKDRWQRIWDSYAGTFELRKNPDLFFSVILRDALFIFELFLRNFENQKLHKKRENIKDYILRTPWLRNGIQLDLILLENQLPFFIFTELFDFILQTQPDNQVDMDMPSYLSKLGHQGHWRDQMERKSHYSFPHFAIEFFGNYYHNGRLLLEERMKNVDHFQHRFNVDVVPSIEETRSQLTGSCLLEETLENVDHFRHLFNANVSPSIEETRPLLEGSSLQDTMENVDHIQHHFISDVLPSIEETRPQLKGSSFLKETMENVDRLGSSRSGTSRLGSSLFGGFLVGSSMLEHTVESLHIQTHFISDVPPNREVPRPQIIADDPTKGIATNFFKDVKHFTDLVRKFLCPTDPIFSLSQPAQPNQPLCSSYSQTNTYVNYNGMKNPSVHDNTCFYSAKQLDRAGVSFVPYKNQHLTNVVVEKFEYKFFPWKSLKLVVPEFQVVD